MIYPEFILAMAVKRLTQTAIAEKAGVHQSTVSRAVAGLPISERSWSQITKAVRSMRTMSEHPHRRKRGR